jgi:AcrR family transcriptional regulator
MEEMDGRLEKSKNTRQNILGAAFSIMVEEGPKGLTAGKITRKANISKASLFHHFASVEDVSFSVLESLCERLSNKMSEKRSKSVADFIYQLGSAIISAPDSNRKVSAAFLYFYQRAAHDETFRVQQEKIIELLVKNICFGIEQILNRPLTKREQQSAPLLIALAMEGLGKFCITIKDRDSLDTSWKVFAKSMSNFFERGD